MLVLGSCKLGSGLFDADDPLNGDSSRSVAVPDGQQLLHAYLNLTVTYLSDAGAVPQTVNIHRVLASWDENTVTWNTFGGAYDTNVSASFLVDGCRTYSVDITSIVRGWIADANENFGVLLDQPAGPYIVFASNEDPDHPGLGPSLRLEFTSDGSTVASTAVITDLSNGPVPDASIWYSPENAWWANQNIEHYGEPPFYPGQLFTGESDTIYKQSLIGFPLIATHEPGGTYTIGYWKNHAGFGPQPDVVSPLLSPPIWLGTEGGSKSLCVASAQTAVAVLKQKTYGTSSNGITKLYAQLLAAKLNIAAGAGDAAVGAVISAADAFLATKNQGAWSSLSSSQKSMVLGWASTLDAYNNGIIGPGHADG